MRPVHVGPGSVCVLPGTSLCPDHVRAIEGAPLPAPRSRTRGGDRVVLLRRETGLVTRSSSSSIPIECRLYQTLPECHPYRPRGRSARCGHRPNHVVRTHVQREAVEGAERSRVADVRCNG